MMNENRYVLIQILLECIHKHKVWISNKPALVQIMAWHRTSDKPLSEPMMAGFTDTYMGH